MLVVIRVQLVRMIVHRIVTCVVVRIHGIRSVIIAASSHWYFTPMNSSYFFAFFAPADWVRALKPWLVPVLSACDWMRAAAALFMDPFPI